MKVKTLVGIAALLVFGNTSLFAQTSELSLPTTLSKIDVAVTATGKFYYLYPAAAWGFPSCASDSGYILVHATDATTAAAIKDYLALALSAKISNSQIAVYIDNCTSRNILQLEIR